MCRFFLFLAPNHVMLEKAYLPYSLTKNTLLCIWSLEEGVIQIPPFGENERFYSVLTSLDITVGKRREV